eukprot:scaffold672070_cov45-Prasinocladus_malaysianus.AAC.1
MSTIAGTSAEFVTSVVSSIQNAGQDGGSRTSRGPRASPTCPDSRPDGRVLSHATKELLRL